MAAVGIEPRLPTYKPCLLTTRLPWLTQNIIFTENPHDIAAPPATKEADHNGDIINGGRGHHGGNGGFPDHNSGGMGDCNAESEDCDNDKTPSDPAGSPCGHKESGGAMDLKGPMGQYTQWPQI